MPNPGSSNEFGVLSRAQTLEFDAGRAFREWEQRQPLLTATSKCQAYPNRLQSRDCTVEQQLLTTTSSGTNKRGGLCVLNNIVKQKSMNRKR
jgi:hypothetical protein